MRYDVYEYVHVAGQGHPRNAGHATGCGNGMAPSRQWKPRAKPPGK